MHDSINKGTIGKLKSTLDDERFIAKFEETNKIKAQSKLSKLEDEHNKTKEELDDLNKRYKTRVSDLESDLENAKQTAKWYRMQADKAKGDYDTVKSDLDDTKKYYNDLKNEHSDTQRELSRTRMELNKLRNKHKNMMNIIKVATAAVGVGAISIAVAKKYNVSKMYKDLKKYQEQLRDLGVERTKVLKQTMDARKSLSTVKDPSIAKSLKNDLRTGEQKLANIDNEIKKLSHQVEVINSKLEKLKGK